MKKILSAVTAAVLSASFAVPAFAYNFSDIVDEAHVWAAPYVESMYEKGYISGYEDGTFRPDNEVTRLECLALFARAMGSKNEANAKILELAHNDYDNLISDYSLVWGEDEIAYLLYKGVLKKSDLDTYLLGLEKDTPMKRYEAAIIITKALGGEGAALEENAIVLDYTDAREIPSTAVQYVNYASNAGIMTGMDDGSFSPNSSVSRAQMAVMLTRTVESTQYSFFTAKLKQIDTLTRSVNYTTADGTDGIAVYTDDTVMRVLGTITQPKIMTTGVQAVFALSGDELVSVDALSETPDEIVVGVYKGYANTNGKLNVTIKVDNETKTYTCASDVSITYAGSPATIRTFKDTDSIELSLVGGLVSSISGSEKELVVKNAVIEDMIIGDDVQITISSAEDEYDGKTYDIDSNVIVKKNNLESELSKIYVGDRVDLTLQYGIVKRITATSSSKVVEGTIKAITIASPNSSMIVTVKGEDVEYVIPTDVDITINDEDGTLYDFRVGDTIKITTESNAITKIVATTTQVTAGSVTGVVTGINTSYGFISVLSDNGQTTQIFCKDSSTTFVSSSGGNLKMSNIKEGQTVTARGTVSNGAFMGSLIIVEAE